MSDLKNRLIQAACGSCALLSCLFLALICLFLLIQGWPAIQEIGMIRFVTGTIWQPSNGLYGIAPMICGSLAVTVLAMLIGCPISILLAVFIVYFCPEKLKSTITACVDLMAGIPSVVYGFFGLMVFVPFIRDYLGGMGLSLLAASLILGIMIIPTVTTVSVTSIRNVDRSCYEGSLALGATPERSVFFSVLPAAKNGIISAAILGLSRAVGETMAVMMVAGNQPVFPSSILAGVRTLTANIAMEMGYAVDLHRQALIATGLILLLFILAIDIVFEIVSRKGEKDA